MVNIIVVRIAAERIVKKGLNPKTGRVYILDDIVNTDYRQAVENYILEHTEEI